MLNIKSLAVAATASIHVKDAGGEPLYVDGKPVRITVHSPGSQAYAAVESRQSVRAVRRANDNEGKLAALTAEERRAETAEDLASITVRFENFNLGELGPTGEALFKAVYADPELGFITKQVAKFVGDWANFKGGSAVS